MGFFTRLVTADETWIHIYDPGTKEHSGEWRQWFPSSKEFQDTEVIKQGVAACLLERFQARLQAMLWLPPAL
jgi:hypothetical protein